MPYKVPVTKKIRDKEYSRKYYEINNVKIKARAAALKRKKRKDWYEFKSTFKCTNCGFSHSAALDFHHVDRTNHRSVNELVQNGKYKEAMEEIKKCIPLCSNCHRIHHHEERLHKKLRAKEKQPMSIKKKANLYP